MSDAPLTAELSKGKFKGISSVHLSTRTSVKPESKSEDESILFKSIPTKNDLAQALERVSNALVDPAKESYGLKGSVRFSFSKIVFHPKLCDW